jgi:hypothetical protein
MILHWSWTITCQILTHGILGLPYESIYISESFVVNLTITLILSILNNPMCEVAFILEPQPLLLFFLQIIF